MKKISLLLVSVMVTMLCMAANPVIYVAQGGSGEGTSWSDPMGSIQQAVDSAYARSLSSAQYTEVWIKAGTYPLSEMITLKDSVAIHGGFAGIEASKEERQKASSRPWDYQYRTVLDGQHVSKQLKNIQVADTIVEIEGIEFANGQGTDDSPVRLTTGAYLHNCIIRDAYSNVSGGAGVQVYRGAHIDGCLFQNNRQEDYENGGGGLFVNTSHDGYTAIVENCEFVGNRSNIRGAAMGVQGHSRITVRNCRIYDNTAIDSDGQLKSGAAIYDNSSFQAVIANNLIYNNTGGTAVYFKGLMLANNTVVKNVGNIYIAAANTNTQIVNNIVWGNWNDVEGTIATGISGVAADLKASNNATYLALTSDKGWITNDNILFSSNRTNWKMEEYERGVGSGPMFDSVPSFYGALPLEMELAEKEVYRAMIKDIAFDLTSGSPCLNTGLSVELVTMEINTWRDDDGNRHNDTTYTYEYPAAYDYLQLPRPQGQAYDMGAMELPYHSVELAYDASKVTIMDEEANPLASGTVLSGVKGQKVMIYIFSNDEQPFTVKAIYADKTEEDLTSQVTEDGLLTLVLTRTMVLKIRFEGEEEEEEEEEKEEEEEAIENVVWNGPYRIYTLYGLEMQPGNLPAGMYILTNGSQTQKVLIQ